MVYERLITGLLHDTILMILDKDYIEFLQEQGLKRPLKIPRGYAKEIIQDRKILKAVVVYLELKPLFYNGEFYQAKSRAGEIAAYLRMSKRAYLYKLDTLEALGFIKFDSKGTMFLCSWFDLLSWFGFKGDPGARIKFYRLKNIYPNSEYLLRRFVIDENFKTQAFAIDKKIFTNNKDVGLEKGLVKKISDIMASSEIVLRDRQRLAKPIIEQLNRLHQPIGDKHLKREKAKYKKAGLLAQWEIEEMGHYFTHLKTMNHFHAINFDISISCQKLANLYGLKSASSGHYWERMLELGKFIETESRAEFCAKPYQSKFTFKECAKNGWKGHHFEGRNGFFKRLNNKIDLLPLEFC